MSARSGHEACELLSNPSCRLDLLITDLTMPGMTGIDLAEEARLLRPGLPVVLMTGYSEEWTQERLKEKGICWLLRKPMSIASMQEAIDQAMGGMEG